MKSKSSVIVYLIIVLCLVTSSIWVIKKNKVALEYVKDYYDTHTEKRDAAIFLLNHLNYKYHYAGTLLNYYDKALSIYDSLRNAGIVVGDPPAALNVWEELRQKYGPLEKERLEKIWDSQTLDARFLIENIETAFDAWHSAPHYLQYNFDLFCEFVLPHRVADEPLENYRRKYYDAYRGLRDSANSIEELLKIFNTEFYWEQNYKTSEQMWRYPMALPISKMELARRGNCQHMSVYCAQVMRACGIPVAIDFVKAWGNRSSGHSWNVIVQDSGKIYPFEPFGRERMEFAYKPAKIFRRMYSTDCLSEKVPSLNDVPADLLSVDELDVTDQYGETFDIEVTCDYIYSEMDKEYGLICVFDNKEWRPVYWGKNEGGKMYFKKMMTDVCYMAAYYDNGEIISATYPFILQKDGSIRKITGNLNEKQTMVLTRKYPRFSRMEFFATNLRRSVVQGADNIDFENPIQFVDIGVTPHDTNEIQIKKPQKIRYVRWKIVDYRTGDLAEVKFYGKKTKKSPEVELTGTIFGYPELNTGQPHPYIHAMDEDYNTFFGKAKDEIGYVGIDLGEGNEHYLTKIRFYPRSDTNYILPGNVYELCYWTETGWKSIGEQTAMNHHLIFNDVPSGTFYILHNLTKGKEERIFTYENGQQIWW